MPRVKVGVLGVGAMGKHHARIFFEDDGTELVAVADIDEKRAREVADKYNCRFYLDYSELLIKEKVRAISIAMPTHLHFQVTWDVLQFGKHVFVEKPITNKSSDARKLIREAERRNLILAVGHVERFNPAVLEFKERLKSGELGKTVSLSARRVGLYPPNILDSNVIVDLAIHDIDIFSYLLGQTPIKVWALGGKALGSGRLDYADILLSYKKSIHGMIQVNWITPIKIRHLAATGTKGYMELDYISQKLKIYRTRYTPTFENFGEFLVKFGLPDVIDINIKGEEPLKRELESFVDCVRRGKKPLVDGKVGLAALTVVEKVLSNLKAGKK